MTLMALGILFSGCGNDDESSPSQPFNVSNSTDLIITDATGQYGSNAVSTPVVSTISVTESGKIKDPSKVTIALELSHTWSGDCVVELISPDGESTTLIKRLGSTSDTSVGDGSDFDAGSVLSFNSENTMGFDMTLGAAAGYPAGDYMPASGESSFPTTAIMVALDVFLQNKQVNGDWKLRLQDYGLGDTGTLLGWSIDFEQGALK